MASTTFHFVPLALSEEESGIKYKLLVPPDVVQRCRQDAVLSSFIMERVKSSFATSSTGERILNVTESLQLMTDMNMISVFGDLARNQGVALGPRAEFDSVSQRAYSRDIPDADLTSLASAAPKHLCTQEKVRFMELAVASLPTQSRTQSSFDAVNKQTTPTDYQAGEAQVQQVWSNPRFVTQKDKEATYTLIDIYGSFEIRKLIGDKKTKSKYVFELIAQQMEEKGFLISDRAEKAWEQCAQKWRNLERSFKDYIFHQNKTGAGKKKKPDFFDELYSIIGQKHTVSPVALSDTSVPGDTSEQMNFDITSNSSSPLRKAVTNDNQVKDADCQEAPSTGKAKAKKRKLTVVTELLHQYRKEDLQLEMEREQKEQVRFDELKTLLVGQHQDRMKAMYALIDALKNKT